MKPEYNRAMVLVILAIIVAFWSFVDSGEQFYAGAIYLAMAIVIIFLYNFWDKIGRWK